MKPQSSSGDSSCPNPQTPKSRTELDSPMPAGFFMSPYNPYFTFPSPVPVIPFLFLFPMRRDFELIAKNAEYIQSFLELGAFSLLEHENAHESQANALKELSKWKLKINEVLCQNIIRFFFTFQISCAKKSPIRR